MQSQYGVENEKNGELSNEDPEGHTAGTQERLGAPEGDVCARVADAPDAC